VGDGDGETRTRRELEMEMELVVGHGVSDRKFRTLRPDPAAP